MELYFKALCSQKFVLLGVDHTGFGPVTSPMPWERSTK